MHRRKKQEDPGAPKWMVTFSDLMTLILVFFILLFSMSVVDAQKLKAIADSFQNRQILDFMPSAVEFENPNQGEEGQDKDPLEETETEEIPESEPIDQDEMNMDQLLAEVNEYLETNELQELISATRDERGVVLVLQERTLFESAEADLLPDAEPFLAKVGTLLEAVPNLVKVEGHTDSRPISTPRFPSNWELSGARASSVIRFLIENNQLDPTRFSSIGYGETRPTVPNTTVENLAKNRRVVIVISDPSHDGADTF